MAARDYYSSPVAPANPFHDSYHSYDHRQNETPPPPPLKSYGASYGRPYAPSEPSTSYASSQPHYYDERNDIPLNSRNKHGSSTSIAPILAHPPADDDPFIRDTKPDRRRSRSDRKGEQGWFRGKITWVVFTLTTAQIIVFIAEIAKNGILTGSPIQTQPSFNPMIGPSIYVLINMGARYVPCMHNMPNVQNSSTTISWPCPNATSLTGASVSCTLSDLCGNGGVPNPHPNGSITDSPAPDQWWRFIVPIFLHAGIIHIGFNMLLQLTLGRDVELLIGSLRFALVYFAAGIFGFVLGGNFAGNAIASTGASGSLFGILAILLLDLLYSWKERRSPVKDLLFIIIDIAISFVLGLLPGLDNFSHIGGFLMGLVLGICILRSPTAISRRVSQDFISVAGPGEREQGLKSFVRSPLGFFQDRRPVWWTWWLVRVAALVGVLIGFILLLQNFYIWGTTCSWCKYLSCLPIETGGTNWCTVGNLDFRPTNSTTPKRDLHALLGGTTLF